jgi:hypothetical protein
MKKLGRVTGGRSVSQAGVHAVSSELYFRNYKMSDLVTKSGSVIEASKGCAKYVIRVLTSNFLPTLGKYFFDFPKDDFGLYIETGAMYVLVLRNQGSTRFLLLPAGRVKDLVASGNIEALTYKDKYRVNVWVKNVTHSIGKNRNTCIDVTEYVENWDFA